MALVHREYPPGTQAFGRRDNPCICQAEVEIGVSLKKRLTTVQVLRSERLQTKPSDRDTFEESEQSPVAEADAQKIVDFREDCHGYDNGSAFIIDDARNRRMMAITSVIQSVDGTRIGDQRHRPRLAARFSRSSARSEVSAWPLSNSPTPGILGRLTLRV